jgi:hypothetical protein
MGSAANGVYTVDSLRPPSSSFAGGRQFLAETKSDKSLVVDEASVNAWLSVHVLANALKGMSTITRSSVLNRVSNLTNANMYGFETPLTTTKEWTGLGGKTPRLFEHEAWLERIKGGVTTLIRSTPVEQQ